MENRAISTKPPWRTWGRNILILLGVLVLEWCMQLVVAFVSYYFLTGHIYNETQGTVVFDVLTLLPGPAGAAIAGFIAAWLVDFRGAAWALLALGLIGAIAAWSPSAHAAGPWPQSVRITHVLLIVVLLPGTYALTRKLIQRTRAA